jgi:hypothetical protein
MPTEVFEPTILTTKRRLPTQDNTTCEHKRQTSMPRAGFEPAIPATNWPQTYALDKPVGKCEIIMFKWQTQHCVKSDET